MDIDMAASIASVARKIDDGAAALTSSMGFPVSSAQGATPAENAGFSSFFVDALRAVDAQERVAGDRMAAVDGGSSDDLVGAMLASQQADLSFSMLMQARNKVVGALDELIKLQL